MLHLRAMWLNLMLCIDHQGSCLLAVCWKKGGHQVRPGPEADCAAQGAQGICWGRAVRHGAGEQRQAVSPASVERYRGRSILSMHINIVYIGLIGSVSWCMQ